MNDMPNAAETIERLAREAERLQQILKLLDKCKTLEELREAVRDVMK